MHAYVINLQRRPDRREAIQAQLSPLNIEVSWVCAIDGSATDFLQKHEQDLKRTSIFPNEYACYLSHIAAWNALIMGPHPYAIILEDDALIAPDFSEVIAQLPALLDVTPVIRLGALQKQVGHSIAKIRPHHRLLLPTKNLSGMQGYVLSKHGAQSLIDHFSSINEPVDTSLDRYWQKSLPIAGISPVVVLHDRESPSDISGGGRKNTSRSHHFPPRIWYSIQKHFHITLMLGRVHFRRRQKQSPLAR